MSRYVAATAWISAILLVWVVVMGYVEYSGLVLGGWLFFILLGVGAGIMTLTEPHRK